MTFFASGAARQLTRRSTRHYPCALMVPRDGIKGNAGEAAPRICGCPATVSGESVPLHATGKPGRPARIRTREPGDLPSTRGPSSRTGRGVPMRQHRLWRCRYGRPDLRIRPMSTVTASASSPEASRRTPPACTAPPARARVLYRSRPPACAAPTPATAACSARSRDSPITDNKTGAARRAPRSTHAQPDHNDSLMKIRHLLATSAATALLSPLAHAAGDPRLHNRPRPPKAPTCRRST